MLERITPLILTRNEEANLQRQLEALSWARRVVIVDSESTDATRAIHPDAVPALLDGWKVRGVRLVTSDDVLDGHVL